MNIMILWSDKYLSNLVYVNRPDRFARLDHGAAKNQRTCLYLSARTWGSYIGSLRENRDNRKDTTCSFSSINHGRQTL